MRKPNAVTPQEVANARIRDHLLSRPGERFFACDIARITGLHPGITRHALNSLTRFTAVDRVYVDKVPSLGRKPLSVYWMGEVPATELVSRVRVWMKKHRKAVVPSIAAKALHAEPRLVQAAMEVLRSRGDAVSCERLLASGTDRFEYRLMGIA